jgi:D-alanine-D-alanine ligase
MAKKIRVGVVFGGRSGEHEISVRSARSVIEVLDKSKYEVIPIAITQQGKWLSPVESIQLLPAEATRKLSNSIKQSERQDVAIIGDPTHKGLVSLKSNNDRLPASSRAIDVLFPVLHGTYGEDGTIQGLFEMANVPYVGCGVLASSCGMDKVTMKALFHISGLPICRHVWFLRKQWETGPGKVLKQVQKEIGFPCFVKPANLGSSVGVSKAVDKRSLEEAINLAARYDRKIIVEEGLDAREIECAVLGNDDEIEASLPGEYVIFDESKKFLDFTEKYTGTGNNAFVVPAPIPKPLIKRIQQMAVTAFKSIDGSGLARVDFFLRRDTNELLINEANTLPGLTDVSGYPKMWEASGKSFAEVLDRLIELAIERHQDKARNSTQRQ